MTDFFEQHSDILVFRIVPTDPYDQFASSHFSHKTIHMSNKGDVIQFKGRENDQQWMDNQSLMRERRRFKQKRGDESEDQFLRVLEM